ncbi:hypothetical protein HanXRQr2_Chr15g0673101 [Helianthus annuus]|uniref:Uncharacterized protein n=1 Tax=Helianthus annuus TaxID=4232 RepID=A0A9K3DXL3_HELAN|nr:hypothetical protein HanXRQr2_Chr15g0673101 [Helianthus annuus]KAJ0471525.1 hypothetical protein HanHA89_Chr15g0597101 [Helianthus annuus]KAJ0647152.1 hypothetical protein HanLR1_Chr15g0558751 [Helianthus annuus]
MILGNVLGLFCCIHINSRGSRNKGGSYMNLTQNIYICVCITGKFLGFY